MLCTTSMVQDYIVHHRSALCTTDLHCTPWCTREPMSVRNRGHPHCCGNFLCCARLLTDICPPCTPWCITQLGGAQCRSVVHNVVLYPQGGSQRRSHKSRQMDLPIVLSLCYTVDKNVLSNSCARHEWTLGGACLSSSNNDVMKKIY